MNSCPRQNALPYKSRNHAKLSWSKEEGKSVFFAEHYKVVEDIIRNYVNPIHLQL
jgi:hypothetical protein